MLKRGLIIFTVFCSIGVGYSLDGSSNLADNNVIRTLEENLVLARQEGNITKEINILHSMGIIYRGMGEYDLALSSLHRSLELAEENNYRDYIIQVSTSLGITYEYVGDFKNAEIFFKKALENARIINDRESVASAYLGLGNIYISLGDLEEAESNLKVGLRIYKELNNTIGVSNILNGMGILLKEKGNYSGALDYYNQSLILKIENRDTQGALSVAGNIAVVMKNLGRLEEAENIYLILLNATRRYGDKESELKTLGNLGSLYRRIGDFSKALDYQNQALDLATEVGDKDAQAIALINLGNVYLSLNKTTEAWYNFAHGKNIATETGNERAIASALVGIGEFYEIEGQKEKAVENYHEASKLFAKFGDFEKAEFLRNYTEILKNEIAKEETPQEPKDNDILELLGSSPKFQAAIGLITIFSFLIGIFRIIKYLREKRIQHSIKLKEEVIDRWLTPKARPHAIIASITEIETHELGRVFYDGDKLVVSHPKDPDLEFFDVFKEHLGTGYPEILKKWEDIKRNFSKYFEECASFVDEIKNTMIQKMGMPSWYGTGDAQSKFILPIRIAALVYHGVTHEARTRKKFHGPPEIKENEVRWGGYTVVLSPDEDDLMKGCSVIEGLASSPENKVKAKTLIEQRAKLEDDYSSFIEELKELKKVIELGNYLRGKCKHCPRLLFRR